MALLEAAVPAIGGLLQGLFGAAAARKAQQRDQAAQMQRDATQVQTQASQGLSQGQQSAFQSLMAAYARALGQ